MEALATTSSGELKDLGIGEAVATKIITQAREAAQIGFETGLDVLEKRKSIGRITTSSEELNKLLGGGIETRAITEFYGKFGSGKTQIAHQLAVDVQLPKEKGGLDGTAIYIDTEGTFRPERIESMAKGIGMDPKKALGNIFVARAYNSDHQILLAEKAVNMAKEKRVRLVVVDSLMSHFRADYSGVSMLARRQQKLNTHLHDLQRKLADIHNIAVLLTNQVMSKPDMFFGDPTKPIGGHILGHSATFRVYLRKSKASKRIARLIDSPNLPEGEAVFKITEKGVHD